MDPRLISVKPNSDVVKRLTEGRGELRLDTNALPYGCNPLFSDCTDADVLSLSPALMGLSFRGANQFLDWLGWQASNECYVRRDFISYSRPESSMESCSPGYLADPCGEDYGVETGSCSFELQDFGRLRRHGFTRDLTRDNMNYCVTRPRYRIDGSAIMSNTEYDMRIATEVLFQDLKGLVITGNHATPGQFDGLDVLVNSDYKNIDGSDCPFMDSIVIDMNENGMSGGAGETWNGVAIDPTAGFINILQAVFRRIKRRIRWSPVLAAQRMAVGDMVLLAPEELIGCILDAFTCWSVCDIGELDQPWVFINSLEGRQFRTQLNGGMFGAGRIFLDGFEIPMLPYEWGMINGYNLYDAFLLTGSVGNVKTLQGQYNDMTKMPTIPGTDKNYQSFDNGLLLTWSDNQGTCEQRHVEIDPRIIAWAPWALARFMDVSCTTIGGPLSEDPCDEYFPYPLGAGSPI